MIDKETLLALIEQNLSGKEISAITGDSWTYLKFCAKNYGIDTSNITYNKQKKTSLKEEEYQHIIDLYENGEISVTKAAELYDIDRKLLSKQLQERGIDVRLNGKKPINSNYFSKIDTPDKAYWLGMLYSDGYINPKNTIELALQKQDTSHLEKFKKAIESKHAITQKPIVLINRGNVVSKTSARITFQDSKIANDLKALGCKNNKSLIIEFPNENIVSRSLLSHFIRGFFDGDGSIYVLNKSLRYGIAFTCASPNFYEPFVYYMKNELGIEFHIHSCEGRNPKSIVINKQMDVLRFIGYMYKNSNSNNRLERKYKKAKTFLENCRLTSTTVEEIGLSVEN